MIRGTTPTNLFTLPFDKSLIEYVTIWYAQNEFVLVERTLTKNNLEKIDDSKTLIKVELSQEETELFSNVDEGLVEIQLRVEFTDGTIQASKIIRTTVGRVLKDVVVTNNE
jgi:hypothetical protein